MPSDESVLELGLLTFPQTLIDFIATGPCFDAPAYLRSAAAAAVSSLNAAAPLALTAPPPPPPSAGDTPLMVPSRSPSGVLMITPVAPEAQTPAATAAAAAAAAATAVAAGGGASNRLLGDVVERVDDAAVLMPIPGEALGRGALFTTRY